MNKTAQPINKKQPSYGYFYLHEYIMYDLEELEFSKTSAKIIIGSYISFVGGLLYYAYW